MTMIVTMMIAVRIVVMMVSVRAAKNHGANNVYSQANRCHDHPPLDTELVAARRCVLPIRTPSSQQHPTARSRWQCWRVLDFPGSEGESGITGITTSSGISESAQANG